MLTVETNARPEIKAMDPLAHWPETLRSECEKNQFSGIVGTVLVSETPTVRIWHLRVPAGGRCPFHRHVNDYFWTAHTAGNARTYYHDGRIVEDRHYVGETKHFRFGPGEFFGEMAREKLVYYPTVTREAFRNQGRVTDLISSGKLFDDLGVPPLNIEEDRVMLCGSPDMLRDMRAYLDERGWQEGSTTGAGHYVIEKAFVEQ